MIVIVVRVNVAISTRITEGVWPATERYGMTILFTEGAHTNKFAVLDIMPMVVTPRASVSTLIGLLMPQIIKGFDGITSNMKKNGFIVR